VSDPDLSGLHPWVENYLQFLGFFRGRVAHGNGGIVVESDRSDFTMLFPLQPETRDSMAGFRGSVLSLPSVPWADETLARTDRRRVAQLVFMSRALAGGSQPLPGGVRVAATASDVADFSLVQSRGFIADPAEFEDWFPWLKAANLRNQANSMCHFLIADFEGVPAAVALLVDSPRACGLYAVATPPEFRGRGLSTRLLRAGEIVARSRGYSSVCLQVYADTYAHGFYARRGFAEDYRVGIWSATA
jgi:GNAT superfamily N-acetyltransferase